MGERGPYLFQKEKVMNDRPSYEELEKRLKDLEQECLLVRESARQVEERYRALFERSFDIVYLYDFEGRFIDANNTAFALLGYSRDELHSLNFGSIIVEDQLPLAFNNLKELRETGSQKNSSIYKIRRKDGGFLWLETRGSVIYREGEPYAVQGIARDITERKLQEESLRLSEERYRGLLDSIEEGYYELDLKGNLMFFNEAACRMLGYDHDEMLGMNYRTYLSAENAQMMFDVFHGIYMTGNPKLMVDYDVISKDGSIRVHEMSASLMKAPSGEPVGFRILGRDVTERNKAEEALRESEEKYRTILERMDEAYFELDLKGNYTFVNESQARILGYSKEELIGINYRSYTSPETANLAYNVFSEIYRSGTTKTLSDYEITKKDGKKILVEMSAALMRGESGEASGFRGVGRDVTDRIQAEKALKESERKYRILAENLQDVIWVLDTNLHYTYVSPSVMHLRGYTPEEAMKQTLEEVLTPESYKKAIDIFASERLIEKNGQRHGKEWAIGLALEMFRKDGSTVWTDVTINLLYDENGTPAGLLGVTRDITERKRAEEALRESEERWQFALEGAGDGVWDFDVPSRKVYRSRRWKEMLGYTEDEITDNQDEWARLVHPEDLAHSNENLKNHLWGVAPVYTSEHRIKCKDGTYKWILERGKAIRCSEDGRPLRIIGTQTDITDRKQAEEAIKKSEERYRTIFENTATSNIIVADDTTILLVNSNFEKFTGYSRQDVENKMSWTHFVVKEDLEKMKQYHMKRRVDAGSAPRVYEYKVRIRSGEIRNTFMSVAMIPGTRDSVASLIDITDRIRVEDALRRSEERFRDLASLLPETVFEADENGILTFVNKSSGDRFGYTQNEIYKGMRVFDVIAPEDHDRVVQNYQRSLNGEHIGLNEYLAVGKDGSIFPTLVHTTVIYRDGKPAGLRGFLIDITEKKNMEQQLLRAQKMEAVGTLAGGIAHDFNNLLMGILGNVSLMLMHFDESHPFFDRLKSVEEYVQRGSDLSKQLLGFARGGKYEVKPTHLGEFIRKSSEMFGRTKKEIRIHHKVAEGLWTVDVDRGQMEQVLLNLFVNAWQAMPGGGDLYLSVENIDLDEVDVSPYDIKPGRFVKVTVTDTGIGMDESVKSRIFEPFFTTKERGRGTGLGLASAYGIIKNHGGFIHVDSEKDFGTSFMIYLPASEKYVQDELGTKDEIMKGQEAVLLIDDEEMILDVGSRMLESLGYKVMPAPGGRQGLLIYEQNMDKIDLVVLDIIMPDFGGKETFDTLRRINPAVRVLLSSGYSLDGQAKEIMQSGCKGFIQKPFSMAELSKKIREILDSAQ